MDDHPSCNAGVRSDEPRETLSLPQLGVRRAGDCPFVFQPGTELSPLILSFPHSGLHWPTSLGPAPRVDFRRHADYAVDRLFRRIHELPVASLTARFSRLVVDLNRAPNDVDPQFVPDHPDPRPRAASSALQELARERGVSLPHRGVVWRSTLGNAPLYRRMSFARLTERLRRFYDPYMRALLELAERRRRKFGYAIIVDMHSMPGFLAPDLVVGTRNGSSCAAFIRECIERELCARSALDLDHKASPRCVFDDPYPGGYITEYFGRPSEDLHAFQIEVNRGLYLDETSLGLRLPDNNSIQRARRALAPPMRRSSEEDGDLSAQIADPTSEGTSPADRVMSRIVGLLIQLAKPDTAHRAALESMESDR